MTIRADQGTTQQVAVPMHNPTSTTLRVATLVARVVLALVMFGASLPKLSGSPEMVTMFRDIGGGTPLRILVGTCELAGAAGLLVPRVRLAAALGLTTLLLGAAVTNVVVLHESPVLPLVLATGAAFVAHRSRRR